MNIQAQRNAEMQKLAEGLKGQRIAMLTLGDARGWLGARPLTPLEMDSQGVVCFMVSRRSMAAVAAQPSTPVNLSFSDPEHSLYVSIAGTAALVDDLPRKERLWTTMARPWFSGPGDPDLTLLCVTPAAIDLWDGPDSSAVRALAMAVSVAAGKPVGLGERKEVNPATSA